MANKIDSADTSRTGAVGPGRAVERPRTATSAGKEVPASSSSGVDITGTARHLAQLEQSLTKEPAVDEARVAQVRSAIEQGQYKVSPQRIADGLLQIERALGHLES